MRDKEMEELFALRDLAKCVGDLVNEIPRLDLRRRDRSGTVFYTPHILSLFRCIYRALKKCKRFESVKKEE